MATKQNHPDSNLFPHATGAAKDIVDAHQAEQPLKLYSGWFCPFVQRAWTVLEEKKIPYQVPKDSTITNNLIRLMLISTSK